jgi:predicted LPLAT superfamily acyltransferase
MTVDWTRHRDRGSAALIKLMAFVSLHAGRFVGSALLCPICAYFMIFAPAARRASREYLSLALGRTPRIWNVFRHFYVHANVLLDRVYIVVGGTRRFALRIDGLDLIENQVRSKQGCILLGAHIGSFEILRALAGDYGVRVKAMMYFNASQKFNQMLTSLRPSFTEDLIPLGDPTSLIAAGHFVRDGGLVALLGDRVVGSEKTADALFFGRPVAFPIGALLLSTIARVPIILFVGLYEGRGTYNIKFEKLSEPVPGGRHALSDAVVSAWIQAYAQRLEHYCRMRPYNWFNFFPIWH